MNRAQKWTVLLLLPFLLAACGGGDDEPATPTAAPTQTPAPTPTLDPNAPITPQALDSANSQVVGDGLCTASVPEGWVDDGTGRGNTPSNSRYVVFGGRVASDADWQRAVELVRTQAGTRAGATVDETDTSIRVTFADNAGFEYRARFGTRYCDFNVSRTGGAIPAAERVFWDAIIESLEPAE